MPTIVVLILVVGGIQVLIDENSPRPTAVEVALPAQKKSPEELVQAACRIALKRELHDPDSVEYLDLWKAVPVERFEKIGYRVQQRVRAKNALGAKVVSVFQCEFLTAADGFRVLSVKELR